jgi:thiol-disulfide isomerase/thioredoxin
MQYFKIRHLLVALLLVGCNADDHTGTRTIPKKAGNQITINICKLETRNGLYLRYDDNMDNEQHYPYDKKAAKQNPVNLIAKEPVILNDDDVLAQGARYVLLAGDSINVTENQNDKLLRFVTADSIRNNELNFFNALKNNLENFNYYKMSRPIKFGSPSNQVLKEIYIFYKSTDYKFALEYTLTKYNDQISFLKDYAKLHSISPKMQKIFEDIFYFDYTTFRFMTATNLVKRNLKPDSNLLNDMQVFNRKINEGNYQFISSYRSSLRDYALYLNATNNQKKLPIYDLIDQNFKGNAKDYLLFYAVKRAIRDQKIAPQLTANFYKDCGNDVYIAEIKHSINLADHKMQAALSDNTGRTTTFEEIKQKYKLQKDTVLYIDFWASWCVPCIEQMAYSAKLRQDLKNLPIRFLYFSMDNSFASWQASSKQLKHNNADNFLVANSFHSPLATTFKLTTIPRYIIISKDGDIISNKDGAPSEAATRKLLITLANEHITAAVTKSKTDNK